MVLLPLPSKTRWALGSCRHLSQTQSGRQSDFGSKTLIPPFPLAAAHGVCKGILGLGSKAQEEAGRVAAAAVGIQDRLGCVFTSCLLRALTSDPVFSLLPSVRAPQISAFLFWWGWFGSSGEIRASRRKRGKIPTP